MKANELKKLRKIANGQLTVNDLKKLCYEQIKLGNGDKFIVVGDDNEGNGYHGMFFGFTPIEEFKYGEEFSDTNIDRDNLIVLG